MAIDPNELARFKNALAKLSSEEIRRRLDGSLIIRPWKRGLAEAEDGRREQAAHATQTRSHLDAANERLRLKDLSRRVWALVGIAIAAAIAVIWTAFPH
jgi:hypothetical protein